MTKRDFTLLILAVVLMAAACTPEQSPPTTTTTTTIAAGPETTTTDSPPQTPAVVDRDLEVLDCDEAADEHPLVCEAYDLVRTHYVDAVDDSALAEGAILGLHTLDGADSEELLVCVAPTEAFVPVCDVAANAADDSTEAAEAMVTGLVSYALDPNSAYLDPRAVELVREEQRGQVEGIGALVSPEDQTIPGDNKQCSVISETCQILIVGTITGAPAERAGLTRDDVIVAVNGQSIIGWTVDEVTATVRGPASTNVTLTIRRGTREFDVSITRAAVVIPIIETETIGDTGYISLASFSSDASSQFERAIVDRLSDGVGTLVIDFRNNPGGLLNTAIDVISVFLADGDVVVTQGPESTSYPVTGTAIVPEDVDVYVIVNKGSASASEVVSATLQERSRAVIVGENTFGKNTVQQRFNLSNGGALRLTTARWLTPEGLDFGGVGVEPDISLDVDDLTPEELVAALSGPA
jgi:carboxyl-terminal processing protease